MFFYFIFAQKEPDYKSMIMMSTYGFLMEQGKLQSHRMKDSAKNFFQYTQCFSNHFCYQHVVDNNFQMMDPCIENKSWSTMVWEDRVCAFVLAISEVNAWLAGKQFLPHDRDAQNMTILDVKGAFLLLGEFEDGNKILMDVPQGFEKYYEQYRNVVLLLLQMIYGTKQAAMVYWQQMLHAFKHMEYH